MAEINLPASRKCSSCKEVKDMSCFYVDRARTPGYRYVCKSCCSAYSAARNKKRGPDKDKNRRNNLKKYGVTPEWFEEKLKSQGGMCSICGGGSSNKWGTLFVDHDHRSGSVRGVICMNCNTAIGHVGDSAEKLYLIAEYLHLNSSVAVDHGDRGVYNFRD